MRQTILFVTRIGLVVLYLISVVGCGSKPPAESTLPPRPPTIQVQNIPDFPVRVMLDGKEVGSYDSRRGGEYSFDHEAVIKLDALPESKAVTAQGLHPDGWKDGVAEVFKDAVNPIIWVKFGKPEAWKTKIGLQVDNRGGEVTDVFVGALPRTIKAGATGTLFYPGPSTAKDAVVRIHGKEVGTLWPADQKAEPDWAKEEFFIDVTGKRSYEYRQVYYSSQGISAEGAEMLKLNPVHGQLSPKHVHRVPFSFSFLCERAPNTIQVKAKPIQDWEVRTEIVER